MTATSMSSLPLTLEGESRSYSGTWRLVGEVLEWDIEGKISAIRHEYGHFLDDQALGFPGQRFYYENPQLRLASERRQYLNEIGTARQIGDTAARRMLIQDYLFERQYLSDNYYFTPDGVTIPYGGPCGH